MRWLIFAVAVFVIGNLLVVSYWRDSQVNLSVTGILFYMLVLPLILIATSYAVVAIYKKIKQKPLSEQDSEQALAQTDNEQTVQAALIQELSGFKVYASALQSSEGSDAQDIVDALKSFKAAELNPVLVGPDGVNIITRHIDLEEDELQNLVVLLSATGYDLAQEEPSFQRIVMLYQRLLEGLAFELSHLAQGLMQFNTWRHRPNFTDHLLHPAWVGTHTHTLEPDEKKEVTQLVAEMQQWPTELHVCYFLPERFSSEQQNLLSEYMSGALVELGYARDTFTLNPYFTGQDISQTEQIKQIVEKIKDAKQTVFLIMGADSTIDQDYIEDIMWSDDSYKASEYGYAMLMSLEQVNIPELTPINYVSYPLQVNVDSLVKNIQLTKDSITQNIKNFQTHKNIELNEETHLVSNIHSIIDYKKLPLMNETAINLGIEADQILFSTSLLEHNTYQAAGFAWVFAASLSTDLFDAPQVLCLSDQEQVLVWLMHDSNQQQNDLTSSEAA